MKNLYSLFIIVLIFSCNRPKTVILVDNNKHKNVDSKVVLPIKDIKPIQRIEQIDVVKDTLMILSGDSFFYYPFGKHSTVESFLKANPQWTINHRKLVDSSITLYKLFYYNSNLSIIRSEDTELVEIVNVSIIYPGIDLSNGMHVGMNKNYFFKLFFPSVNKDVVKGILVVKVKSALDGIWNDYYFKGDTLNNISFKTDYTFNNQ